MLRFIYYRNPISFIYFWFILTWSNFIFALSTYYFLCWYLFDKNSIFIWFITILIHMRWNWRGICIMSFIRWILKIVWSFFFDPWNFFKIGSRSSRMINLWLVKSLLFWNKRISRFNKLQSKFLQVERFV